MNQADKITASSVCVPLKETAVGETCVSRDDDSRLWPELGRTCTGSVRQEHSCVETCRLKRKGKLPSVFSVI